MIKAFHQVGGGDKTPAQRATFLNQILDLGEIIPAIQRVKRGEMYNECLTEESQGCHSVEEMCVRGTSPLAREALALLTREKLALLPEEGTTHTMFNCIDLLAGDFERIFLSIGDWYDSQNGFVFNAEELVMAGASYRSVDLLGYYDYKLTEALKNWSYDSVVQAKRAIEAAFESVHENHESKGEEALTLLRVDCAKKCPGEIVWPGPLPLGLAIEMWSEGRKTSFHEGAPR